MDKTEVRWARVLLVASLVLAYYIIPVIIWK